MDKFFEKELTEYIIQGEAKQKEKSLIWKTAIGLQDVDHLSTSEYLLQTAKDHIEGKIDIDSNEGGYVKFDYDGKRYIYYNCFVESVADID